MINLNSKRMPVLINSSLKNNIWMDATQEMPDKGMRLKLITCTLKYIQRDYNVMRCTTSLYTLGVNFRGCFAIGTIARFDSFNWWIYKMILRHNKKLRSTLGGLNEKIYKDMVSQKSHTLFKRVGGVT